MDYVAIYNSGAQIAGVYNIDLDHEIVFALVNTNEWHPIGMFAQGEPRKVPPCFRPDPTILKAMDTARDTGKSFNFSMD